MVFVGLSSFCSLDFDAQRRREVERLRGTLASRDADLARAARDRARAAEEAADERRLLGLACSDPRGLDAEVSTRAS